MKDEGKEELKPEKKTEELEEDTETLEEELKDEELETALAEEEEEKKEPVAEDVEAETKVEEEKPAEEEEARPPAKEKKAEEEEIVEERIYTVPLGKAWISPPNKRTSRAVRMLRSFMIKHMKMDARKEGGVEEEEEPARLTISNQVNLKLWERGIEKPPRKIRVRAAKDKEGNVTVYLAEGD